LSDLPSILDALVVAGGSSRRMGFDKLTSLIGGRPALSYSLEAMQACGEVRWVVLVCPAGREDEFRSLASDFSKVTDVCAGGSERWDSVRAGAMRLADLPDGPADFVAVHDAARPLIRSEEISLGFDRARKHGAAALAERVADSLHRCAEDGTVLEPVPRENLWRVQTPQILKLADLLTLPSGHSDEISALRALGKPAVLVENAFPNFKLTVPGDLLLAEAVLRSRIL
jgi:2-C-methyl-D-erythritol 4-phosphate cytidylyltransferase